MRKNEFRYNSNPDVKNPKGKGHVAYVTVRHGKRSKINIITHGSSFYGEPTELLLINPNRLSKDTRPSRFSVPIWESNTYLKDFPKVGYWKMSKADRIKIKKFNKRYKK